MDAFLDAFQALLTGQAKPTVYLVHAAMLAYAAGFVFRSQVTLRLLVLIGTGFYIAYYALHPETPLWDAIFASTVIGTANLYGLMRIALDRLPLFMGADAAVLEAFERLAPGTMRPGEVRRLMRRVRPEVCEEHEPIIREGRRPTHLYLLIEGGAYLRKNGGAHPIPAPCFVGEIAFLTGRPASADVVLAPGTLHVAWPVGRLATRLATNPSIETALRALISTDMATKLALSTPAGRVQPEAEKAEAA